MRGRENSGEGMLGLERKSKLRERTLVRVVSFLDSSPGIRGKKMVVRLTESGQMLHFPQRSR
jgi:hypothetical protein